MTRRKRFFGEPVKKVRGWKKKHRREVKISDITAEGFRLRTFNKEYYVSREKYPWFKNATVRQIQDVVLFPCCLDDPADAWQEPELYPSNSEGYPPDGYPDHGDHLRWESLDLDLGTNDFEYPKWLPLPKRPHPPNQADINRILELRKKFEQRWKYE